MNDIQIFNNDQFGQLRTVIIDKEPWFVGKDAADILGYQNGSRDVNRHVEEDDRRKEMIFDGNQNKETIVINESGLYSLVFGSHLPSAKEFKHWRLTDKGRKYGEEKPYTNHGHSDYHTVWNDGVYEVLK